MLFQKCLYQPGIIITNKTTLHEHQSTVRFSTFNDWRLFVFKINFSETHLHPEILNRITLLNFNNVPEIRKLFMNMIQ